MLGRDEPLGETKAILRSAFGWWRQERRGCEGDLFCRLKIFAAVEDGGVSRLGELLPGQPQNRTYKLADSVIDISNVQRTWTAPTDLFTNIDTSVQGLERFAAYRPAALSAGGTALFAAAMPLNLGLIAAALVGVLGGLVAESVAERRGR